MREAVFFFAHAEIIPGKEDSRENESGRHGRSTGCVGVLGRIRKHWKHVRGALINATRRIARGSGKSDPDSSLIANSEVLTTLERHMAALSWLRHVRLPCSARARARVIPAKFGPARVFVELSWSRAKFEFKFIQMPILIASPRQRSTLDTGME